MSTCSERIRLLLAHDQVLMRESLSHILNSEPDLQVVRQCDSAGALEKIEASAEVAVLHRPDFDERPLLIARLPQSRSSMKLLLITTASNPEDLAPLLGDTSIGLILEQSSPESLIRAIRTLAVGCSGVDARIIRQLADGLAQPPQARDAGSQPGRMANTCAAL